MQTIIALILASLSLTSAQNGNNRETMKSPFSIGLGVLSPSYSQKIGGSGSLDVMQDNSGFSYALNNVAHPSSPSEGRIVNDERVSYGPSYQFKSAISQATGSKQSEPIVSIYHTQQPRAVAAAAPAKPQDSYSAFSVDSNEDDGSYKPELYNREVSYSPEVRVVPEARPQPIRQYDTNAQQRQYFQIQQNPGNFQSLQSYQQPQTQKFELSQPTIYQVQPQAYEQPRNEAPVQQQSYSGIGSLGSILSAVQQSNYEPPKPFSAYQPQNSDQSRPYSMFSPFQASSQPQSIEIPKASYSPQRDYELTKALTYDSEPEQQTYKLPSPQRGSYSPITFQTSPDRVNLQPVIPEKYLTPLDAPERQPREAVNDNRFGNFDFRSQLSHHQPPQSFQHSFNY